MSVFVTGGSGFIGESLIARHCADGHVVRALARTTRAVDIVTARGAGPVAGSLADVDTLVAGMRGASAVVHAAARLTAGPREREDMWATEVTGTATELDAAIRGGVFTLIWPADSVTLHSIARHSGSSARNAPSTTRRQERRSATDQRSPSSRV